MFPQNDITKTSNKQGGTEWARKKTESLHLHLQRL